MPNGKLYEKLIEYSKKGRYPLHMPGHKRQVKLFDGVDPYDIDITEIKNFDDLHNATGIIKEAMDAASDFLGTDRTWFVVNGSTCSNLSAIHAVTEIGDHIVVGSNCHWSVTNAAEIRNLKVTFIEPIQIENLEIKGGYNPEKLEKILAENSDIKAVVLTSPTYDGIISDIESLAKVVHEYDAVLIVDEAHGAHLGISDQWPEPAYNKGADVVVQSAHKMLPAMTQTSLLHLMGHRVDEEKISHALDLYESSSPSYVLMASLDYAMKYAQEEGEENLNELLTTLEYFRKTVNNTHHFSTLDRSIEGKSDIYAIEPSKLPIIIKSNVISGEELADILRYEYNYEVEFAKETYILAMTSMCDDFEKIEELARAIQDIDEKI